MTFTPSRRDFLATSARGSAAAALATSAPLAVLAQSGQSASANPETVSADLLHALGARIGFDIATEVGSPNTSLQLSYIDAAGPGVDALREGLERGIRWQSSCDAQCRDWQAPYASILAAALISNPATGRRALVEIEPTALSMIALLESVNVPPSAQKQAIMSMDASNLYRVSYDA